MITPPFDFRRMFDAIILMAFSLGTQVLAQSAENYAILVAVDNYQQPAMNVPKLHYTIDDAKAIGERLTESNYTVDYMLNENATRAKILAKLAALKDRDRNAGGIVFVGLFGHGTELESNNLSYFCPYDAKLVSQLDPGGKAIGKQIHDPDTMVSLDAILASFRDALAGQRVLVADCCRFDRNAARGRSVGSNISIADLPPETNVLLSCSSEQKAYEHSSFRSPGDKYAGHGAFTKCLLDAMSQHSQMGSIYQQVKPAVTALVDTTRLASEPSQSPRALLLEIVDLKLKRTGIARQNNPLPPTEPPASSKTLTSRSTGMEFVLVPKGTFIIGSPTTEPERYDDETPHQVTLTNDYYLAKFEVTQGEFEKVMGFNPSNFTDSNRLPVETVSWFDAVAFCNKLSELDGLSAVYTLSGLERDGDSIQSATVDVIRGSNGYRLPTEAEWEYACRAGTKTPFSFGANITTDQINYDGNYPYNNAAMGTYREKTMEVDALPGNAFGLHQMHGNVLEWCWDWYADYPSGSLANPSGPTEVGSDRVFRGGSWYGYARFCRSASRDYASPDYRYYYLGFRVALGR